MAKVLVIRKQDKTIHKVPIGNKSALLAFNNRQPAGKQWKFEEMDEDEAAKLPFIDESYVTAGEAQVKVKQLEADSESKDKRIAELEALLAKQSGSVTPTFTALETIELINAATSSEQVKEILGADDRKTVLDAAAKKMATFKI